MNTIRLNVFFYPKHALKLLGLKLKMMCLLMIYLTKKVFIRDKIERYHHSSGEVMIMKLILTKLTIVC